MKYSIVHESLGEGGEMRNQKMRYPKYVSIFVKLKGYKGNSLI